MTTTNQPRRVFMSIEERKSRDPIPILHVNGQQIALSHSELAYLISQCSWASTACRNSRAAQEFNQRKLDMTYGELK